MVPEFKTAAELSQAQKEAKRRLWHKGVLSWKFQDYPWAKDLYNFIRGNMGLSPHLDVMIHRRGTKSTTCLIVGIEECLRTPNARAAVLCTTKEQAREVCDESMTAILADCPDTIYPRRIKNDFAWVFDHNGSKIIILSADKLNAKSGRGRKFRFIHVMEAAFIPNLAKILRSILAPTLRDVTGKTTGTMVLESTPPDEGVDQTDIEYWEKIWTEAEVERRTFFLPLSANKYAAPSFVEQCKKDFGGEENEDYQREFELRMVHKSGTTAIPEATPLALYSEHPAANDPTVMLPPIVREVTRPEGADRYEGMDPGGMHPTGMLWAFYHFEENLLVIEDEWLEMGATSDLIATTIKAREGNLWPLQGGKLLRVADNNNLILLRDLHKDHQLVFYATAKDDKDAQINKLRVMMRDGRLAIHPRCKTLIKTLRIARRAKAKRKGFEEMDEIGHADLLDALLYIVRNVRKHAIPDPAPTPSPTDFARPAPPPRPNMARKFSLAAFGRGLRRW